MQLLISDANVLIDMDDGGLMNTMFQLPYEFEIPDILYFEELADYYPGLVDLGLVTATLESDAVAYGLDLSNRYLRASRNDCFALALAKQDGCPLLTGDLALRKAAEKEGIEIRGTIWLVEEMLRHDLIDVRAASESFDRMRDAGSRLPWALVGKMLKGFK